MVIVAIGVASILFDGLSQTQIWFDVFGFPALPIATLELLVFLGIVIGIAVLVARAVGLAAVGAGLLPIAIGYLVAHYLTYLLGDGQLIVVALSDPFQLGWDLLGTAFTTEPPWIPRRDLDGDAARRRRGHRSARRSATSSPKLQAARPGVRTVRSPAGVGWSACRHDPLVNGQATSGAARRRGERAMTVDRCVRRSTNG